MRTKTRSLVRSGLNRMVLSPCGTLLLALLVSGFILTGCVQQTAKAPPPESVPSTFTGLMPVTPQPSESSILPGVRIWYLDDFYFNHIAEMPRGEPPYSWGFAGKPCR